jgi:hypothetical protein
MMTRRVRLVPKRRNQTRHDLATALTRSGHKAFGQMRLNRIARQIRLTAVWLRPALAIDRVDQCTASTGVSSGVFGHPLHVLVGDPARRAGAGPVVQTVEPAGHEPTGPLTDRRLVDTGSAEPLDRCFTLGDADVTEVRCAWSA